mgnify:CR=1 FL=1
MGSLCQNRPMFTVFVEGLEFYAFHGVTEAEREVGHRFIADIEVVVDGSADYSDRLEDTVSYADLVQAAAQTATAGPFKTVERLAGVLAERILSNHETVKEATVHIAKRLPPLPAIAEEVGAEVTRQR